MLAILTARRPRTWSEASITYHFGSTVSFLAKKVFINRKRNKPRLPVQAVNPFAPDFLRLSGAWRQSIPAIGARLRSLSGQESKRGRVADRPKQIFPALPRTETELL